MPEDLSSLCYIPLELEPMMVDEASYYAGVGKQKNRTCKNMPLHHGNRSPAPPSDHNQPNVYEQCLSEVEGIDYSILVERLLDAYKGPLKNQDRNAKASDLDRPPCD